MAPDGVRLDLLPHFRLCLPIAGSFILLVQALAVSALVCLCAHQDVPLWTADPMYSSPPAPTTTMKCPLYLI